MSAALGAVLGCRADAGLAAAVDAAAAAAGLSRGEWLRRAVEAAVAAAPGAGHEPDLAGAVARCCGPAVGRLLAQAAASCEGGAAVAVREALWLLAAAWGLGPPRPPAWPAPAPAEKPS